jgi:hypothetical protein
MLEREKPPLGDGGLSGMSKAASLDNPGSPPKPNKQVLSQAPAAQTAISRNARAVREARLELLREAVFEACGFIRLHAEVCQTLADVGDDAGLLHSLGRLIAFTKEAARGGSDLRAIRDQAASNKEGNQ